MCQKEEDPWEVKRYGGGICQNKLENILGFDLNKRYESPLPLPRKGTDTKTEKKHPVCRPVLQKMKTVSNFRSSKQRTYDEKDRKKYLRKGGSLRSGLCVNDAISSTGKVVMDKAWEVFGFSKKEIEDLSEARARANEKLSPLKPGRRLRNGRKLSVPYEKKKKKKSKITKIKKFLRIKKK